MLTEKTIAINTKPIAFLFDLWRNKKYKNGHNK